MAQWIFPGVSRVLPTARTWGLLAIIVTCLLLSSRVSGAVAAQLSTTPIVVHTSGAGNAVADGRPGYFAELFQRVLNLTTDECGPVRIVAVPDRLSQRRLVTELHAGRLDVIWTAADSEREMLAIPVRIPIDMGLIGQRVPVIRADRAAEFAAVRGIDDLKQFTACQGAQWPDEDIMAASGLPQVTNAYLDQLYAMLRAGRCDYFARGVAEVAGEVDAFGDDLIVFEKLVIAYAMPIYFFVTPGRDELARRLENGLRTMVDSGELRQMLTTHPSTRGAFPLERFNDSVIIRLNNPNLPPLTPLGDSRLWISLGKPSAEPS